MLNRIHQQKTDPEAPWRSFKAGPGGLVSHEFLAQLRAIETIRTEPVPARSHPCATRNLLASLTTEVPSPGNEDNCLLENYDYLRTLEHYMRRNDYKAAASIPRHPDTEHALAFWMGAPNHEDFRAELTRRMAQSHTTIRSFFNNRAA